MTNSRLTNGQQSAGKQPTIQFLSDDEKITALFKMDSPPLPPPTEARLIRTPTRNKQFRLSRQKTHIFSKINPPLTKTG